MCMGLCVCAYVYCVRYVPRQFLSYMIRYCIHAKIIVCIGQRRLTSTTNGWLDELICGVQRPQTEKVVWLPRWVPKHAIIACLLPFIYVNRIGIVNSIVWPILLVQRYLPAPRHAAVNISAPPVTKICVVLPTRSSHFINWTICKQQQLPLKCCKFR